MTLTMLASLLPLATFLACTTMSDSRSGSSSTSHGAGTSEDSCHLAPLSGTHLWEGSSLHGHRVREVIAPNSANDDVLLQHVSDVGLADQQTAGLVAEPLPDLPGTRPHPTRGVLMYCETRGGTVYTSEDQVVLPQVSSPERRPDEPLADCPSTARDAAEICVARSLDE
jgi:hypothetical protein